MESISNLTNKRLEATPRTKEVNILGLRNPRSQASTDKVADYLVQTFNSPEYRPAFCKIAWRLDEGTIYRLAGSAKELGNRNPRGYFIACARNEMKKLGVSI